MYKTFLCRIVISGSQGRAARARPREVCLLLFIVCIIVVAVHSVVLSSCPWSLCVLCIHMLLGWLVRAVLTGHSLCLARGQHTFDVFIVLKIRGVIYGKKFFLKEKNTLRWSKLPLNRFQISEDETPHIPIPVFRENTKNGSHTLPHSGIKYGKPVSVHFPLKNTWADF
jgi:hypothetical protein